MAEDILAEKQEAPSDFDDVDPDREMVDIQWLKAKYVKVLDREGKMLEYVLDILEKFNYRLKAVEERLGEG